jgi:hypothetical protein
MVEEGYQGYENWETWNTSLWLSNDEGMYLTVIDIMENNPYTGWTLTRMLSRVWTSSTIKPSTPFLLCVTKSPVF